VKRPAFWIVLALLSIAATLISVRYFPEAFSIIALDITMDRDRALDEARAVMARDQLGPSGYRQAASFALDEQAQTFVELEGGGKDAFSNMMRSGLYSAYTWRVRQFKEGETNETTIRFTPDGKPYGFIEKLKEDAPGAALQGVPARRLAEREAGARWNIDLSRYALVEQGQERRQSGRVDHTLTYERPSPSLNEGRYRLRLVVSGDRLTEVTHFVKIPEAFTRRYESMRSANQAIGIGSVIGMALIYVLGGIGVGLFFMLRKRWVLWKTAAVWGTLVGLMQALAGINELPLIWMTYDTAVPRSTFIAQQIAVGVAGFLGFSVFFAVSFMAAETLTRRAFGHHPQFWRVWAKEPGASVQILGRTMSAYLLVSLFFAYDVLLYLVATKLLGWWSPSEALLHPDVLATYAPWLSAIANSFQAGFWEEALFRAVPIAGAALIGDRLGHRRLFLVLGFIVQALIFGAGHAPYPNQPSFARPVELIVPSIGFGLLYLYFGLLPGIILHFAFDVVWFALPIFLAHAPGLWLQKLMVVVMTVIPVWVVLWRRVQVGHWTQLSPADLNAAWMAPPAEKRRPFVQNLPQVTLGARARTAWLAVGVAALLITVTVTLRRPETVTVTVSADEAAALTRQAIAQRGVTLPPRWRVMPVPDDGNDAAQEFVSETAGEARRRELVGRYLPAPGWRVRAATFQGDVAERAEEWRADVSASGEVRDLQHTLPEGRAGASLDEASARAIALRAVTDRFALRADQLKEISAKPTKLKARIDWTLTFADATIQPLPQGEPRIAVHITGNEVASSTRFVFVPEAWERQQRAAATRNLILRILETLVFAGLVVGAGVGGTLAWSRGRYTPRLFLAGTALMLVISVVKTANGWPMVLASLTTAAPLQLQVLGIIGIGLVGLTVISVLVGLALGALPRAVRMSPILRGRDAVRLGIAAGLVGAAASSVAHALRTPAWAHVPDLAALGTEIPILQIAVDPVTGFLTRVAVLTATFAVIEQITHAWTRRRVLAVLAVGIAGFVAGGLPAGSHVGGWIAAGLVLAAALIVAYVTLFRFDLTVVPLAVGTMTIMGSMGRGLGRPYPGAFAGSLLAALVVAGLAWWWFRALRRARAAIDAGEAHVQV
jgi:hypothetical protein